MNKTKDPREMTEPVLRDNSIDGAAIASQAAALAVHLERSGVQWLPKPRADHVEMLIRRMSSLPTVEASNEIETPSEAKVPAESVAQSSPIPPPSEPEPPRRLAPVETFGSFEGPYPGESLSDSERERQLRQLEQSVSVCRRCEVLASCRKQTVFGEGSVTPRVAFFGEGPGAEEDRSGRPFVGRAGQLLTKMIEACKFQRRDVYILNTVKCRPPGNRNPEPAELENCREYYQQQLSILRPEYIVCLGAVSAQELLKSKLSVGRLRGKLHRYFESKVLVTYHPAYLLRNPAAKKAAWEDLQIMLRDAKIPY